MDVPLTLWGEIVWDESIPWPESVDWSEDENVRRQLTPRGPMTGSFELKYAWVLGIGSHPIYRRQPAPKELLQNKIKVRHKLVLFCLFLSVSYTWPTGIGTMILWSPCGPKHVTEYWPVTLSNIRKKGGISTIVGTWQSTPTWRHHVTACSILLN